MNGAPHGWKRRTRELPELLLGIALITVGFLCYAIGTAAKLLFSASEPTRGLFTMLGLGLEGLGQLPLIGFAWRVFHPRSRVAAVVAVALGLGIIGAFSGEVGSGQFLRYSDSVPAEGPWVPLGLLARGTAPAWMAFECLRFHRQLRRRLSVGLADPLVVNRVALWGWAMAASAMAYVTSLVHRALYGTGVREHLAAVSLVSALAMVAAVCLGLAAFPPRWYRARVDGRSASG